MNKAGEETFTICVSGTTEGFTIGKDLLTKYKDTPLEVMFSGRHELSFNESDQVVLDRDPELFKYVTDYLRFGELPTIVVKDEVMKHRVKAEFDYWCLKPQASFQL